MTTGINGILGARGSFGKVAAFDIGGTNARHAIIGTNGELVSKISREATDPRGGSAVVDQMRRMVEGADVGGIGVSFAGPTDPRSGVVLAAPNINGFDNFPLAQKLMDATGLPVFIIGDAKAGAMAEWMFGGGRGMQNLLWVTVSTGFGSGAIVNGGPVFGANNKAGEIGHIKLGAEHQASVMLCGCGKHGCAEVFAGDGLVEIVKMTMPELYYNKLTAKEIVKKAADGNVKLCQLLIRSAEAVAGALAAAATLQDPEKIFVAGSLGTNPFYYFLLQRSFADQSISFRTREEKEDMLALSEVNEPSLLGAAAFAMQGISSSERGF